MNYVPINLMSLDVEVAIEKVNRLHSMTQGLSEVLGGYHITTLIYRSLSYRLV